MTDSHDKQIDPTSTGLLRRARAQNVEAWHTLVNLYTPLVMHWLRRWKLQPRDAENVGQEVFLQVSKSLDRFRKDKNNRNDTFRGWMYTITHRCFVDFIRRQEKELAAIGGTDGQALFEGCVQQEDVESISLETSMLHRQAVKMIKDKYSEKDWLAFYRVVVDGQKPKDVAVELRVSKNQVYLAKSRILKHVREEFEFLVFDSQR